MISIIVSICLALEVPPPNFAFVGYTDATSQVYVMDLSSKIPKAIGPTNVRGPVRWSPDGRWLACSEVTDTGQRICLIPVKGGDPVYIEHAAKINQFPRWHPNSQLVAYQSGTFPETTISVYDLTHKREQTWGGEVKGLMRPVWLQRQEFVRNRVAPPERDALVLMGTGGLVAVQAMEGNLGWTTQLAVLSADRTMPFPDFAYEFPKEEHSEWNLEPGVKDRSFVYESNDGGDREIFLVNKDRVYNLSNHRAADINPVWSPDGKWIAFESYRNGRYGIYRAHRDSGRVLPMLVSKDHDYHSASWLENSKSVMAVRSTGEGCELIVFNPTTEITSTIPVAFTSIEHITWQH